MRRKILGFIMILRALAHVSAIQRRCRNASRPNDSTPADANYRIALGWRVTTLEPNRVLGLENWGTFVLQPVDSMTTRLIVRTRGAGRPSLLAFVLAPLNAFVFEPAHFIMERGMLRGIRDRAERRVGWVGGRAVGNFRTKNQASPDDRLAGPRTDETKRDS